MPSFFKNNYGISNRIETSKHCSSQIILTKELLLSSPYKALSASAKVLFSYMKLVAYSNNTYKKTGSFVFTISMAKERCNMSKNTAIQSFKQLETLGFIKRKNDAPSSRHSAEWAFSQKWRKLLTPVNTQTEDSYGYVYIFKMGDTYKIGSSKDPQKRFKSFANLPHDIEQIACVYVENFRDVEKTLLNKFKSLNTKGEWFLLTEKEVEIATQYLENCVEQSI